jgi:hypothetical protein
LNITEPELKPVKMILRTILLFLVMMNLFSVSGQSTIQVDKALLTDLVRAAEKLKADNIDLKGIDENQKLIIESQGVRIIELENMTEILQEQIGNIKVAYSDIVDANQKKRFWIWLKGVGLGIVTGAATVIIILIL